MAQTMVNMAAIMQNLRIPDNASPIRVELPPPPALTGALTPNNWLAKAQRLAFNRVLGPHSLAIGSNGYVYTGLSNGWVVEVRPNGYVRGVKRMALNTCGRTTEEGACGRPLGMRLDKDGLLVFADAYGGIFKMDPGNGQFVQLVNSRQQLVEGRPLGFLNDLAVTRDGTIFFTSSSSKWSPSHFLDILLEGETSGKLLMYNSRFQGPTKVHQVQGGLSFPTGLQLSSNEDFLLIAEGARARILRAWIGPNTPKRGSIEVFADNLPGFVANMRLSPRGTLWVALSSVRHSARPSLLDTYGASPHIRRQIMGMPKDVVMSRAPKYGLVLELSGDGKVVRSLHDPSGEVFPLGVSEVQEHQGKLFLGSWDRSFIGVLSLSSLPLPIKAATSAVVPGPGPGQNLPQTSPTQRPTSISQPNPQTNPHLRPNPTHNPNPNLRPNPQPSPNPNPGINLSSNSRPNLNPIPNPNSIPNSNLNSKPSPNLNPNSNLNPNHNSNPNAGSNARPNPSPNLNSIPNPNASARPNPNPNPIPNPIPRPGALTPASHPSMMAEEAENLGRLLAQMNRSMDKMNGLELREMVLVLLKQVIDTKKEANKTMERAVRLKSDMGKMKKMLGLSDPAPAPPSGTSNQAASTNTGSGAGAGSGNGTGNDAGSGSGTTSQKATVTLSTTTVASETTPHSTGTTPTVAAQSATPEIPTVPSVLTGLEGSGPGSVDGGGAGGDGGSVVNDPMAPSFPSECMTGDLSCGLYK